MLGIVEVQWNILWYLKNSNLARDWNPLPVGKSLNIRAILGYTEKIPMYNLVLPHVKYNCVVLFLFYAVLFIYAVKYIFS